MSGTVIKLFTIFSFAALLAVCVVPGSDASDLYAAGGSGTSSDPYTGVVFIDPETHHLQNVYVEVGTDVYVYVDRGYIVFDAWDDDVDPSTFEGYDDVLSDGSPDTVPGMGGTEYTVTAVLGVIPEGVTGINVGIFDSGTDNMILAFGICVVSEDGTYSETADNDYDDYEGEKSYSPMIALIIVVVLFIGILLLLRKVVKR